MATTKARVRTVVLSDIATVEAEINAIVEAEEANGFVLDDASPKIIQDPNGGIQRVIMLTFQHQDYAPGGTGSGGVPFQTLEQAITVADLTDAALFQEIAFAGTIPANILVLGGEVEVKTAEVTGASTTASIGDTGDPDEYCTAQDVRSLGHKFVAGAKLASGPALEAAYVPVVRVDADVNVDTLTTLDMIARLFYINLPDTP